METWMKLRHTLTRDPKLRILMRHLRIDQLTALGLAVRWLAWIDEHTTDGNTQLTAEEMDAELGIAGAYQALAAIGWTTETAEHTVQAVDYGKHCGATAKARGQATTKKAQQRDKNGTKSGQNRDKIGTESGQNRDKNGTESGQNRDKVGTKTGQNRGPEEDIENKDRIERNEPKKEKNESATAAGQNPNTPAPPDPPNTPGTPQRGCAARHPQAAEIRAYLTGQPHSLSDSELQTCAQAFEDSMTSTAWHIRGMPCRDWHAAARAWLGKWQRNQRNQRNTAARDCNNNSNYR